MYNEHLHFKDGEGETLRGPPPPPPLSRSFTIIRSRGRIRPGARTGHHRFLGRRLQTRAAACSVSEILLGHRHLLAAGHPGLLLCNNAAGELWPQQTYICSLAHQALFVEPWPGRGVMRLDKWPGAGGAHWNWGSGKGAGVGPEKREVQKEGRAGPGLGPLQEVMGRRYRGGGVRLPHHLLPRHLCWVRPAPGQGAPGNRADCVSPLTCSQQKAGA